MNHAQNQKYDATKRLTQLLLWNWSEILMNHAQDQKYDASKCLAHSPHSLAMFNVWWMNRSIYGQCKYAPK